MDLPIDFINKMKRLLGHTADDFFSELKNPSIKAITVNFNRMEKNIFEKLCNFNIEPIEFIHNGYIVNNLKFADNIYNHLGVIYSQEPSAMYPVELLDVQPNDIVLDISAAPGGKSVQILEKLNNTGLLIANEIVFNRAKILYENLSRMGFCNFAITCNSPNDWENSNIKFDKIIVDAPCGGEGMIRKKEFDMACYNPQAIETNAKRQLNILESIKSLLKDGGKLVYSTCTYDIRENEDVIVKFLKNNPNFKIVKQDKFLPVMQKGIKIENFDTDYGFRRYPHLCKGEGQFMICLEKIGDYPESSPTQSFKAKNYQTPLNKELTLINKSLKEYTDLKNLQITKRNDNFFVLPDITFNFENLNLIHIGCCLGLIQKNIFKFNHNFYHSFGNHFRNSIDLTEEQIHKYLQGEEVDTDLPNGIYCIKHNSICSDAYN